MSSRASITVLGSPEEIQRLWQGSEYRPEYTESADAAVTFTDAPGDRGTEIHVDLSDGERGGKVVQRVKLLAGKDPRAKVMDDLRRFKQVAETGVIARSEAVPEGEQAERKLKSRPAQPLSDDELEKAEVQ